MDAIQAFLGTLKQGRKQSHLNMTLIPLLAPDTGVPDYLILQNTTSRYGKGRLMKWFLLSQIYYTYYILRLIPEAVFSGNRWD